MNKLPEGCDQILKEWNGGKAKIWSYDASFSTLFIRVEKQGLEGYLFIRCRATTSIFAPTLFWEDCNLSAEVFYIDEYLGSRFLLLDADSSIRIECRQLSLVRSVDDLY